MNYCVNKKTKKQLISIIRKNIGAKVLIPRYIYSFMFVVIFLGAIILTLLACPLLLQEENGIYWCFMWGGIIFCFAWIVALPPICIRAHILRKYMMPWIGKKDEKVELGDEELTHKYINIFWQGYRETFWWSAQIKYKDIVRIEYDEKQHLLRIYGPYEHKKYNDDQFELYISRVKINSEDKEECWIELPDYFENFDEIKVQLEERTGLTVINQVRPFETYR